MWLDELHTREFDHINIFPKGSPNMNKAPVTNVARWVSYAWIWLNSDGGFVVLLNNTVKSREEITRAVEKSSVWSKELKEVTTSLHGDAKDVKRFCKC